MKLMFLQDIEGVNDLKPYVLIDKERENEGDLFFPAQICNDEIVNFFIEKGKGLLCVSAKEDELLERGFFKLPSNKSKTNFFIPVDYGTGTGISASERCETIKKISEGLNISKFIYPGHVNVLGGKKRRWGHTEASIFFAEYLGFKPYGVIVEILNDKGDSHDFKYILNFAKKYDLEIVDISDLYKEYAKSAFSIDTKAFLPTKYDENFEIYTFNNIYDEKEHVALVKRPFKGVPLVRIHSECATGDIFHSLRCDCGEQLEKSLELISKEGGVIIYLRQEGRGIGLNNKIKAYKLQDEGLDTVEANLKLGFKADERDYYIAYLILKALNIDKIKLLTNNPEKFEKLRNFGIQIEEIVRIYGTVNKFNKRYLETKVKKMNHLINLELKGVIK